MSVSSLPPGCGPVLTTSGHQLALWCECQHPGPRAARHCVPVGVRPRWPVPELVFALLAWHREGR